MVGLLTAAFSSIPLRSTTMLPAVKALATAPADASGPRRLSNDPAVKVLGTWDTWWPDCGEDAIVFLVRLASDTSSAHRNVRLSRPRRWSCEPSGQFPNLAVRRPYQVLRVGKPSIHQCCNHRLLDLGGRRRLIHNNNEGIHDEEMRNSWKKPHLSQNGEGCAVAHGERSVFLYGAYVTMMACYVRFSFWY